MGDKLLENKVLKTIEKYNMINNGEKIVVAVSGGPDSICLLNILNNIKGKLNIKIVVAHVNHSLREEADEETEYVKNFCKKLNIECYIKKVDIIEISKKNKVGTEEAGRKERYDFFDEVFSKTKSDRIATAHNLNDNAETVLMNIIRGSGLSGLKGIEEVRDYKYIRPLIEISRKEIEEYCKENKLEPKYDKSNKENIYTRNKIRNILIPLLEKEFNPNIVKSISKLSELAKLDNEYFNNIIKSEYNRIKLEENHNEIILNLKEFNKLNNVIKSRLILYTITRIFGSSQGIEKIHIDDIIKLCGNNIGNKYLTPNKKIKIYVKKSKVFFMKQV